MILNESMIRRVTVCRAVIVPGNQKIVRGLNGGALLRKHRPQPLLGTAGEEPLTRGYCEIIGWGAQSHDSRYLRRMPAACKKNFIFFCVHGLICRHRCFRMAGVL